VSAAATASEANWTCVTGLGNNQIRMHPTHIRMPSTVVDQRPLSTD